MIKYDANYWEYCNERAVKKRKKEESRRKKIAKKKEKERRIIKHNSSVNNTAIGFANSMKENPSELEKRMKDFLDNKGIIYDFQKVFTITDKTGKIKQFFIVDFYIPSKNLVIETDGKFHEKQEDYDEIRTQILQHFYPNIKVIRWRWHDFESLKKLKELSAQLE